MSGKYRMDVVGIDDKGRTKVIAITTNEIENTLQRLKRDKKLGDFVYGMEPALAMELYEHIKNYHIEM